MKLAFVFPGQGSQSVGMMQGFDALPVVRKTFEEAGDILMLDLWQMVSSGPVEVINQTINTQPVMLTAGVAVYRAWQEMGGTQPEFMAGHSLGEYTALVAAGALSFADALPLVRYRAEVMQEAVAEGVGGMAAILGLDDDVVRAVCAEAAQGEVVEAVNFNSPGQVVIAGSRAAVERGMELAKAKGAKRALPLPVSVPSHCSLMKPAAEKLAIYLQSVAMQTPLVQVLHNADVKSYSGAAEIKDALVRQLFMPVRWVETVQALAAAGVTHVAECGPGKVLAGLNKRIVAELQGLALTDAAALEQAKSI
ncbi:MAG: ACP S-malonyltransferase [Gammaproteobacteria bacterium]|nr:ACP S-malonyltransferase [Gammaproteobacteria bacterium]MBU1730778.1 ACP S-malonyltransferase [Gammaproteobacteria bacterium]MBU1891324.1 ACP S-malonyltransferase [Gammaproteobacteria bacterium]